MAALTTLVDQRGLIIIILNSQFYTNGEDPKRWSTIKGSLIRSLTPGILIQDATDVGFQMRLLRLDSPLVATLLKQISVLYLSLMS